MRSRCGGDPQWTPPVAGGAAGEEPTFHAPVFVVTHRPAETIVKEGGTSYIFVTKGVDASLTPAQKTAGSDDVLVIGGA